MGSSNYNISQNLLEKETRGKFGQEKGYPPTELWWFTVVEEGGQASARYPSSSSF